MIKGAHREKQPRRGLGGGKLGRTECERKKRLNPDPEEGVENQLLDLRGKVGCWGGRERGKKENRGARLG